MDTFTPLPATIGGLLIGLSAAMLWLGNGRIAGISGIFGQLLPPARTVAWRLVFLVALVAGTFAAASLFPALGNRPASLVGAPAWFAPGTAIWVGLSGILTGFGTKIGNGCTSGHGVCGLARLSKRSFVAVGVFFVVAILTVTLTGIV
ncbi:MAG TPA: YeeE/YedE family protein [Devosia sp.]|nr:YeeE/YedE family protein [Devosia sp.]